MMPARHGGPQSYGAWAQANPDNPEAAAYLAARDNALSAVEDTFTPAPQAPAAHPITLPRYGDFELDERSRMIEESLRQQDIAGTAIERARRLAEASQTVRPLVQTSDIDPEMETRRAVALNGMRVAKAQAELDEQNRGTRSLLLSIQDLPPDEPPNADRDAVRRRRENTALLEFYGHRARQLMTPADYDQASVFVTLGRMERADDGAMVPAGPSNPPFGN
jgi:hypothetical protein